MNTKSLGQICFEGALEEMHKGVFNIGLTWSKLTLDQQNEWEAGAYSVAEAILRAGDRAPVTKVDPNACPDAKEMKSFACEDKTKCFEECGDLSKMTTTIDAVVKSGEELALKAKRVIREHLGRGSSSGG